MTSDSSALSLPAIQFMLTSTLDSLDINPQATAEDREIQHQAAIEALTALKPRDANEANLAAQAVVAHHAAMACFRRAAQPNLPDSVAMRILGRALAFSRLAERMQTALQRGRATRRTRSQPAASAEPAARPAQATPAVPPAQATPTAPPAEATPAPAPAAQTTPATPPVSAAMPQRPATQPAPTAFGGHAAKPVTTRHQLLSSTAQPPLRRATA